MRTPSKGIGKELPWVPMLVSECGRLVWPGGGGLSIILEGRTHYFPVNQQHGFAQVPREAKDTWLVFMFQVTASSTILYRGL